MPPSSKSLLVLEGQVAPTSQLSPPETHRKGHHTSDSLLHNSYQRVYAYNPLFPFGMHTCHGRRMAYVKVIKHSVPAIRVNGPGTEHTRGQAACTQTQAFLASIVV